MGFKNTVKVAVTGAGGQIGYSLLFRLASGEVFGSDTQVELSLLELPVAIKSAEGTAMEIDDCAFPTLKKINICDSPDKAFDGIHWGLFVGSKPRGPGMERNDLIKDNGPIFVSQGRALEKADKNVRVLVVGNPCNTNALIALKNSKAVPASSFFAMTMLDENRAKTQLAQKAGCNVGEVKNLVIWGNHSSTMVPDFDNAKISGQPCTQKITDRKWLEEDFLKIVQKRGAAIIDARGKSSAASAASACIDHVKRVMNKTPDGEWFSGAVLSDGNPYGIPSGLMFSFPLRSHGNGKVEIIPAVKLSDWTKQKIALTVKELEEEKAVVRDLLG